MEREELKQIYYLNKEVKMWEKELERIQYQSLARGQQLTGMPAGTKRADRIADMAADMADITTIIQGKLAEIQIARKRIIEYISNVEDSYMRQVIYLRNVSCLKWEQIADEIGGSGESIRVSYNRYLKKA